jgi:ABC-2 type transport system permease protein
MAVYEHEYKPYSGAMTPNWSRLLVIPRHMFGAIFQSKLFVSFFAVCYACPLVMAVLIYLHHNLNALKILNLEVSNLIAIDSSFFLVYCYIQSRMAFLMAVIVGPILISRDLTNNALPLYLSRPFSRTQYVLGKASVLGILLSAITWVPGLLLFVLQSCLEGWGWMVHNLWMAGSIVLASLVWIVILTLLAMALSAWIKRRIAASALLFGIFVMPSALVLVIDQLFRTGWGAIVSISYVLGDVIYGLFGVERPWIAGLGSLPPLVVEWLVLIVTAALCLFVLSIKIQAYEVSR